MAIGKLERVDLRELWKHEARGFSAWLADNLESLSGALGLQLTTAEREVCAGDFDCDLVAEDERSERVIIENQLEASNHDHLGKLITYLTNLEAKRAIWICKTARPEHVRAIAWLNETTPDDVAFYLVQLEAYRIGASDPAPLFTMIVGPSAEQKDLGRQKKELAQRHILRLRFWEGLLGRAKQAGLMTHSGRSPSRDVWLTGPTGKAGLSYTYRIWMKEQACIDFYIDTNDQATNDSIFDRLLQSKASIEASFGAPLDWERVDGQRHSRVRFVLHNGGLLSDESEWPRIQDAMIDAMARLVKTMKPLLPTL